MRMISFGSRRLKAASCVHRLTLLLTSHRLLLLLPSAARSRSDKYLYDNVSTQLHIPWRKSCDGALLFRARASAFSSENTLVLGDGNLDLLDTKLGDYYKSPLSLSELGHQACNRMIELFPSATQVAFRARFYDQVKGDDVDSNKSSDNSVDDSPLKTFQIAVDPKDRQFCEHSFTLSKHLEAFDYNKAEQVFKIHVKLRYTVLQSSIFTRIRSDQGSLSELYRVSVIPVWDELSSHIAGLSQNSERGAVLRVIACIAYKIADNSSSPHRLSDVYVCMDLRRTCIQNRLSREAYEAWKETKLEPIHPTHPRRAYIALGSNLGDRFKIIEIACKEMTKEGIKVLRTSLLYESQAMYVEEQPPFINGVCEVETTLDPAPLLARLQEIEKRLGRKKTIDKGPRNIDLDILLYEDEIVKQPDLVIPHKDMLERTFVLTPLCDLIPHEKPPSSKRSKLSYKSHLRRLIGKTAELLLPLTPITSSLPPISSRCTTRKTHIMAILNLTPDSFSDGGVHTSNPSDLLPTLQSFVTDGATILDVGGQSTRPNAPQCSPSEELARILPTIRFIRSKPEFDNLLISVDTYRASVAATAVEAGANIINDVSAGTLDPDMLPTAARLGCTIILMHMRGDPSTMNNLTDYPEGVVEGVTRELIARVLAADEAGIFRWRIILDPGIGFAKTQSQNLMLLRFLKDLRLHDQLKGLPWCVGTSRKRFIGDITGVESPSERLMGTATCVAAAVKGGADIVRVHDVKEMSSVVKMGNALWRQDVTRSKAKPRASWNGRLKEEKN